MELKREVVMLPTNEKAKVGDIILVGEHGTPRLIICTNSYVLKAQQLYFLSDEEIKKGDWCLVKENRIFGKKGSSNSKWELIKSDGLEKADTDCKKIIATTDESLLLDIGNAKYPYGIPLPKPSHLFLEAYVEAYNQGNPIRWVNMEYEADLSNTPYTSNDMNNVLKALKESSNIGCKLKINPKDNTVTIRKIKNNWNREEVIDLIKNAVGKSHDWSKENKDIHSITIIEKMFLNEWIAKNL